MALCCAAYLNDLQSTTADAVWEESVEQVRVWSKLELCPLWTLQRWPDALSTLPPTHVPPAQTGAGIGVPASAPNFWFGIGSNCTLACSGRNDCNLTDARTSQCSYEVRAGGHGHAVAGALGAALWPPRALALTLPRLRDRVAAQTFRGRRLTSGAFRHVTRLGQTNQMTIRGRGKSPHPMHLHTMHVQLQADLASGWYGKAGDWRDTVPAIGERDPTSPLDMSGRLSAPSPHAIFTRLCIWSHGARKWS